MGVVRFPSSLWTVSLALISEESQWSQASMCSMNNISEIKKTPLHSLVAAGRIYKSLQPVVAILTSQGPFIYIHLHSRRQTCESNTSLEKKRP